MAKNVKGLAELHKFFDELPAKIQKNVMRGALRAGAIPIAEEVKQNVPVNSGELRDGIKVDTGSEGKIVYSRIRATGRHSHIAHWIEYGTKAHFIKATNAKALTFGGLIRESVQHPGTGPHPFMRPALEAKSEAAFAATAAYMRHRLSTKEGLEIGNDEDDE